MLSEKFRHILCAVAILVAVPSTYSQSPNRGRPELTVTTAQTANATARYVSPSHFHRVMLFPKDGMTETLSRYGAIVRLEDYGSFAVAVVDDRMVGGVDGLANLGCPPSDHEAVVSFNALAIDTADAETLAKALDSIPEFARTTDSLEEDLVVVQFEGPVRDGWLENLRQAGLSPIAYIPANAFILRTTAEQRTLLEKMSSDWSIRMIEPYHPFLRIHPDLFPNATRGLGQTDVTVQLIDGPDGADAAFHLTSGNFEIVAPIERCAGFLHVRVRIPNDLILPLARHPAVFGIEPIGQPTTYDENQAQIVAGNILASGAGPSGANYLTWLSSKGINVSATPNFVIDVEDSGLDRGTIVPIHDAFRVLGNPMNSSRIAYAFNYTTDPSANDIRGHGTHAAGIIGGYNDVAGTGNNFNDASGFNYGLGIMPNARIGASKIFDGSGSASGLSTGTSTRLAAAYANNARISNNSWGGTNLSAGYDTFAREHDVAVRDAQSTVSGNQQLTIVFAAGNSGGSISGNTLTLVPSSIRSPVTAKNVITVGASEGTRGLEGIVDTNAFDFAYFSSEGPCSDGRTKPDIVAPGTAIAAATSQDTGYTGAGLSATYWPNSQTEYSIAYGTSQAAPAVSGAAGLVRMKGLPLFTIGGSVVTTFAHTPSPSMIKAKLMTTAAYLTGFLGSDTLPSNRQGMGRVDLGRAFDGVPVRYLSESTPMGLTGLVRTFKYTVGTSTAPLRIGLVWTDAPGATTGNAYVNNLDLEVEVGGTTYLGNNFSGGLSIAGGTADFRNNAEFVFLPAGQSGEFTIRVRATNIVGDGRPGNSDLTDQDYSVYIYNAAPPVMNISMLAPVVIRLF